MEHQLSYDPEHLHRLKTEILTHFRSLPTEHQATIALVIAAEVIDTGEYGDWLRQAIGLTRPANEIAKDEERPRL